jgi:hypothetical protein
MWLLLDSTFRERREGEVRYGPDQDGPGPPARKQEEGRPGKRQLGKGGEDRPNAVTLMTLRLPRVFRLCHLAIISYTRWPFLNPHVGVFAGGALPGTLRIAEIDPNRSRCASDPPGVSAADRACRCGWHLSKFHMSQVMRRDVSGGNSGGRFSAKAARPIL